MVTAFKHVVLVSVCLMAFLPLAFAQGTYTQIDDPNAVAGTYCYGIDTAGDIVGYYHDASGVDHGFLLSGGQYTTVDYPGGVGVVLTTINDSGQIAGSASAPLLGFVYDLSTQLFTTVNYPGASFTVPYSINNSGEIVGWYESASGVTAFALVGSTYRPIRPPGEGPRYATGITESGAFIVGYGQAQTEIRNFAFTKGEYRLVTIPDASGAVVEGVDPQGSTLVGYYQPTSGGQLGFVRTKVSTQTLQFPGATETFALGVNSGGEVVGVFYDTNLIAHGFLWTPPKLAR